MVQSRPGIPGLTAFLLPIVLTSGASRAQERPKLAAWVVCDGSAGAPCDAILRVSEGLAGAYGELPSKAVLYSIPASSSKVQPGPGGAETSGVSRYLGGLKDGAGKLVPDGVDGLLLFDLRRADGGRPMLAGSVLVVPRSGRWVGASADALPVRVWNGEGKERSEQLLLRGSVGGALWKAGLLPASPKSRPFPTSANAAVYGDAVMDIPAGLFP